MKSRLEWQLDMRLKAAGFPQPEKQFRFHPTRRWTADFAYPQHKILIECEGGCWVSGRHNRGAGFTKDCEKYNQATVLGWKVLRYTGNMFYMLIDDLNKLMSKNEREN